MKSISRLMILCAIFTTFFAVGACMTTDGATTTPKGTSDTATQAAAAASAAATAMTPAASKQRKPRLAILPLTGGTGEDAETIAELFSFEPDIDRVFTIVPRTSILNAIKEEQRFQRDGLTSADNIKAIGERLNTEYVLSGSITTVGNQKLLLISIIHVEYLQQIAGAYREYKRIEDVDGFLPEMAKQIAASVGKDTGKLR